MDAFDRAVLRWGLLLLTANHVAFAIHQWWHS
jgi:hypothetical protein